MKKLLLFASVLLSSGLSAQTYDWVKNMQNASGRQIVADPMGMNYSFGNVSTSAYIVKNDANGMQKWAISHYSMYTLNDIEVNNAGTLVYLAGNAAAGADITDVTFPGMDANGDAFIAIMDSSKHILDYIIGTSTVPGEWVNSIAVDNAGNIYATGEFNQDITFGSTTLTPSVSGNTTRTNMYIAKFDPTGAVIWANAYSMHQSDSVAGRFISLDETTGNLFVLASIEMNANDSLLLGSSYYKPSSAETDVLIELNTSGMVQGYTEVASGAMNMVMDMDMDASGNVYLLESSSTGMSYMITKLDPMMMQQWQTTDGTSNTAMYATDMEVSAGGNVYVGGYFYGQAAFGSQTLNTGSATAEHGFAAGYDAAGAFQWVSEITGTGTSRVQGVSLDAMNNVYISGAFIGDVMIGSTAYNESIYNAFMAKLHYTPVVTSISAAVSHQELRIYPNPVKDMMKIKMTTASACMELVDITGRTLLTQPVTDGAEISVENIPSGVYMLKVTSTEGTAVKRIVIQ
jgi:hypothetical protein